MTKQFDFVRYGLRRITFDDKDISMLATLTSCVNNICINGCIPLLFATMDISEDHPYAVFLTYDLPRAQHDNDAHLWKVTQHTSFWTKKIWIIPIFRQSPGHWVLCIADFSSRELRLFDSFAERKPWRTDIEVCCLGLITLDDANCFSGHRDAHHTTVEHCKDKPPRACA